MAVASKGKAKLSLWARLMGIFLGPGSLTDFGERFLILDRHHQTSVKGMYAIGDVAGTPDVKAALNAGYRVGQHIARSPRRTTDKVDYDVIIVGAGPAGINAANELQKVGKKVLVIERKRMFQTIHAFAKSKALFLASTGDQEILGDFSFDDCSAEECLEAWRQQLEGKDIDVHEFETVNEIKRRGAFEVWTRDKQGESKTYLADRIIVAVGKPRLLEKLAFETAGSDRIRYQLRYTGGVEDKDVLVVAHAGSYEGFEMALDLAPNNRVTLIYEDDDPDIDQAMVDRINKAAEAGRLNLYLHTSLQAIHADSVDLMTYNKGGETLSKTLPNQVIFTGKIIDRELPATDLRSFGLNVERRMNPLKWIGFGLLFLFIAFVYLGKGGYIDDYQFVQDFKKGLRDIGGGLQMYQWWIVVYSLGITIFGFKAMYKYRTRYRDGEQGSHQTKRLLSLMFFQVVFLAILPELVLGNWRSYGVILAWPLNLNPKSYAGFIDPGGTTLAIGGFEFSENHLYFAWTLFMSFALIPILVWRKGMRYCTWICSCGGLAETVGDEWRQFSPKGPANTRRERFIYVVLGFTAIVMVLSMTNTHLDTGQASGFIGGLVSGWGWVVDLSMCGIIPLVLYPYLGGRTWCRYACPTAGFMKLMSRQTTVYGIQPDKKRCIACGTCDRFCEVGVPIKKHALKGQYFSANDTTCISCGVCLSVCPTDVLSFQLHPDKRVLPMSV